MNITQEMLDAGTEAMLAFRKSGEDWTTKPAHAAEAAIRAALNHRHSGGDGEAWRGIDSAPRDGERIILGRPDIDGEGGISVAGYWLEEVEDGVDYMGADAGFTDVDYHVFHPGRSFGAESYRYTGSQPTHWRPLPAPPIEDAARTGERG